MNKAIGILVIGLGLVLIVIGIQGSQGKVLASLKSINPKLRSGIQGPGSNAGGTTATQPAQPNAGIA